MDRSNAAGADRQWEAHLMKWVDTALDLHTHTHKERVCPIWGVISDGFPPIIHGSREDVMMG